MLQQMLRLTSLSHCDSVNKNQMAVRGTAGRPHVVHINVVILLGLFYGLAKICRWRLTFLEPPIN